MVVTCVAHGYTDITSNRHPTKEFGNNFFSVRIVCKTSGIITYFSTL